MRIDPYNFFRQATKYLRPIIPYIAETYPGSARVVDELLTACANAPKFILPNGGRILDGSSLRGLPGQLRLPFPEIVIEFTAGDGLGVVEQVYGDKCVAYPKRLVYAQEFDGWIDVCCFCGKEDGVWTLIPVVASLHANDESIIGVNPNDPILQRTNAVAINSVVVAVFPLGDIPITESQDEWDLRARLDINDETNAVLSLIEALACINVTHERVEARKQNKSAAKRGALPFDEYRVLTIQPASSKSRGALADHRSPREHLRRGHIRRISDSRTVWVNACVVNAGTIGKITSDYKVAA